MKYLKLYENKVKDIDPFDEENWDVEENNLPLKKFYMSEDIIDEWKDIYELAVKDANRFSINLIDKRELKTKKYTFGWLVFYSNFENVQMVFFDVDLLNDDNFLNCTYPDYSDPFEQLSNYERMIETYPGVGGNDIFFETKKDLTDLLKFIEKYIGKDISDLVNKIVITNDEEDIIF